MSFRRIEAGEDRYTEFNVFALNFQGALVGPSLVDCAPSQTTERLGIKVSTIGIREPVGASTTPVAGVSSLQATCDGLRE